MDSFISLFTRSVTDNWDSVALIGEPGGESITYGGLAEEIIYLHSLWKNIGLKRGDKIAICGKNCKNWAEVYLAAVTGGYKAVLLPTSLGCQDVSTFVNHSGSVLLYINQDIYADLGGDSIPDVLSVFDLASKLPIPTTAESPSLSESCVNKCQKIAKGLFSFPNQCTQNEVCTIIYTSGSTGRPKAAQLTIANINDPANYSGLLLYQRGECHINTLPFYHIFGLVVEMILPLCFGMRLVIPDNPFSVSILQLMRIYHPRMFITIPFFVENLIASIVGRMAKDKPINEFLDTPETCMKVREFVQQAMGGNIELIFTGGSMVTAEAENLLIDKLDMPMIVAYGCSECGLVSIGSVGHYVEKSCGKVLRRENLRIDSTDSQFITGEIQVKGNNVFVGYYNDPEATNAVFTEDGWFKTGDLGTIDKEHNLYITGRCKEILLTSNGENIYPGEIETILNSSPYIRESILLQRGEKLHAIIVPDKENVNMHNLDRTEFDKAIKDAVLEAGKHLPGFAVINSFELTEQPLERTPKGGIKRFVYS